MAERDLKIDELTEKYIDAYGKWEAGHFANDIIVKRLDDLTIDKERLEKNLALSLSNRGKAPQNGESKGSEKKKVS